MVQCNDRCKALPADDTQHLGALQGKTYSQKRAAGNTNADPTAESSQAFTKRALDWWDKLLTATTLRPEVAPVRHVLVVSHGGFISTLVKSLLAHRKMTWADGPDAGRALWTCLNCSVTTIEITADVGGKSTARLVKYGDTAHLDGKTALVDSNVDVLA